MSNPLALRDEAQRLADDVHKLKVAIEKLPRCAPLPSLVWDAWSALTDVADSLDDYDEHDQ